jgi:hypothetical protein
MFLILSRVGRCDVLTTLLTFDLVRWSVCVEVCRLAVVALLHGEVYYPGLPETLHPQAAGACSLWRQRAPGTQQRAIKCRYPHGWVTTPWRHEMLAISAARASPSTPICCTTRRSSSCSLSNRCARAHPAARVGIRVQGRPSAHKSGANAAIGHYLLLTHHIQCPFTTIQQKCSNCGSQMACGSF